MKLQAYNFCIILLLVGLSACARPLPDLQTSAERIAAIEISYQEVLDMASRWSEEGRLSNDTEQKFTDAFDRFEASLFLAKEILRTGNELHAAAAAKDLNKTLLSLRTLLAENSP